MDSFSYQKSIVDYYRETENAYRDSWSLDEALAIHYGYWDKKVKGFRESLERMNEVMAETAAISSGDLVLDAGCGVGGSSLFLANNFGCSVTGISLSQRQVDRANKFALDKGLSSKVNFKVMNYAGTSFDDATFDVIWACESVCYAEDKLQFVKEAFRLLKPDGRLILADGFVTDFSNNRHPVIRNWLDGWCVNFLESPGRFQEFMSSAGFTDISYSNISEFTVRSSKRLYRIYFLARLYLFWKTIRFSNRSTKIQKANIIACRDQYRGLKARLWEYGLFSAVKS